MCVCVCRHAVSISTQVPCRAARRDQALLFEGVWERRGGEEPPGTSRLRECHQNGGFVWETGHLLPLRAGARTLDSMGRTWARGRGMDKYGHIGASSWRLSGVCDLGIQSRDETLVVYMYSKYRL